MTYTPDSLREAAQHMFNADAKVCRACADAWEAERAVFTHVAKERSLLRDAHVLDMAVADAQSKRLEEATESNAAIASAHWELCKRLEEAEKVRREAEIAVREGMITKALVAVLEEKP